MFEDAGGVSGNLKTIVMKELLKHALCPFSINEGKCMTDGLSFPRSAIFTCEPQE